ncbi:hypothetical protein CBL_00294 [Carabus blaptoides fortunei]
MRRRLGPTVHTYTCSCRVQATENQSNLCISPEKILRVHTKLENTNDSVIGYAKPVASQMSLCVPVSRDVTSMFSQTSASVTEVPIIPPTYVRPLTSIGPPFISHEILNIRFVFPCPDRHRTEYIIVPRQNHFPTLGTRICKQAGGQDAGCADDNLFRSSRSANERAASIYLEGSNSLFPTIKQSPTKELTTNIEALHIHACRDIRQLMQLTADHEAAAAAVNPEDELLIQMS